METAEEGDATYDPPAEVDRTLIREMLARSPFERLEWNSAIVRMVESLRVATFDLDLLPECKPRNIAR